MQSCPLCESNKNTLQRRHTIHDIIKHLNIENSKTSIAAVKNELQDIWNQEFVSIFECNDCHFVYAQPFVSGSPKLYSLIYQGSSTYLPWKWDFEITKKKILELLKSSIIDKDCQLLEIGAGMGSFVREISNYIYKENITCTEYSDYGANTINEFGIECIQESILELNQNSKYQVVCMFQVLEHMDNLDAVFTKLNTICKSNADLFITVPNNLYRNIYDSVGIFMDIPPIHLSRWNRKNFEILAKKHGWKLISNVFEPMSVFLKLRKFLFNIYFQKKSLSAKIDGLKYSFISRILRLSVIGALFFINMRTIKRLISRNVSVSQWIHMKRI